MPARLLGRGLALALVLGCGSRAPEPRAHAVEIRGMLFVPFELEVRVGDTVTWTNHDVLPHNVVGAAGAFDSGTLAARQAWTWTATAAGERPYACTLHPTMKGKLVVR